MDATIVYDLVVHYGESVYVIGNIDPGGYSYLEFMDHVMEHALSNVSAQIGIDINIYHDLPNNNERVLVDNDKKVKDMFMLNKFRHRINVFVETEEPVGVDFGLAELMSGPTVSVCPAASVGLSQPTSSSAHVDVEDDRDEEDDDDIFGFSSEDEEWKAVETNDSSSESSGGGLVNEEDEGIENNSKDGFSDYQSDDDCRSDSEDEVVSGKKDRNMVGLNKVHKHLKFGKEFQLEENGKIKLHKGQIFDNVKRYREVLKDYAIQEGFKLWRIKNEKKRVTCKCAARDCPWRIHASPLPDLVTYQIKSYDNNHSCFRKKKNKEANSTWIAKKLANRFKETPNISLSSLYDAVHTEYGVEAHRMQLYRAKRKALDELEGNHGKSYSFLPAYAVEVIKSNPGSLVEFEHHWPTPTSTPEFQRIFISFEAMKTGFLEGCRPFIGLDGCHLKGVYGGVLLAAIALDGNNGLFPIAFGVVESESKSSWTFFLNHLHTIIAVGTEPRPLCFMSDMQKGLEQAIANIFPDASHRRCCRHLFNNFKKNYPGLMVKRYFWRAVRAYNVLNFQEAMNHLRELSPEGYDWLMRNVPVESWSRHAFNERVKSDHVTSNMAESFNSWVGELRHKPILTLLDGIRTKLMERIQKRFEKGCDFSGMVTPNIRKKLNKVLEDSRTCTVIFAGGEEYEVMDQGFIYVVHLGRRTCICNSWQVSGLPCKHAATAIAYNRYNIERFCDSCYTNRQYLAAYGNIIHPIIDQQLWSSTEAEPVDPPTLKRLPGRPKKNRRREFDEPAAGISDVRRSLTVRCMICKAFGHNRRTCQRAEVRNRGGNTQASVNHQQQTQVGRSSNTQGSQATTDPSCVNQQQRGRGIGRGVDVNRQQRRMGMEMRANSMSQPQVEVNVNQQQRGRGTETGVNAKQQQRGRGKGIGVNTMSQPHVGVNVIQQQRGRGMGNLSQPTPIPPTAYSAGRGVMSQPHAKMNVNHQLRGKGTGSLTQPIPVPPLAYSARRGVSSMSQPIARVNANHQPRGKEIGSISQPTLVPSTSSAGRGVNNVNEHVGRVNKLLGQRGRGISGGSFHGRIIGRGRTHSTMGSNVGHAASSSSQTNI